MLRGKPYLRVLLGLLLWSTSSLAQSPSPSPSPKNNPDSSIPSQFFIAADHLFFSADDGLHGRELWMCDSSGAASLAADCEPGPGSSGPRILGAMGGWLFFTPEKSTNGSDLWVWDPGKHESRIVRNVNPGRSVYRPAFLGQGNGRCYFTVDPTGKGSRALWTIVPEKDACKRVEGCPNSVPSNSAAFLPDGALVFATDYALWRADGDRAQLIKDINTDENGADRIDNIRRVGGKVVFTAYDSSHGSELWVTDGTAGETHILKDIRPGPRGSNIIQAFSADEALFFQADDGTHGIELWCTDATEAGTRLVKDIQPGNGSSDPHYFAKAGSSCYFAADDGTHGIELWKTDGTEASTVMVADLFPGIQGSGPWSLAGFHESLYFCAKSPSYGEEVFMTRGTADSTVVLKDVSPGPEDSGPGNLAVLGDVLFFSATDSHYGEELWMSLGSPDTTRLATDIRVGGARVNPSSSPRGLAAMGNTLVFVATDREHGDELWRSDGTPEGTRNVCDLVPGPGDSSPQELTVVGTRIFFSARVNGTARELWVSDGNPDGAHVVGDPTSEPRISNPRNLLAYHSSLYFISDKDGTRGQLWRCTEDGAQITPALDSVAAADIAYSFSPFELRGGLYCFSSTADEDLTLWRLPEANLTAPVRLPFSIPKAQSILPNVASIALASRDADSAAPDPATASAIAGLIGAPGGAEHSIQPATIGNMTYFCARTRETGAELWKTDGTTENTALVIDAFAGPASSSPALLTPVGDFLFFVSEHPREGRVLWRTRGTAETTEFVRPLDLRTGMRTGGLAISDLVFVPPDTLVASAPNPTSTPIEDRELQVITHLKEEGVLNSCRQINTNGGSFPRFLTRVNNAVYFAANDGIHGEELWILDPDSAAPRLVKDILTGAPPERASGK
ncbi:MAG: hypothetical protein HZB26_25655 [Candidatus Hydrogenedentes bacterium]|nr:hypothetical protein [Candidatus Hydrogenedentota bacterium]